MPRKKLISDSAVLTATLRLLTDTGARGVSFATVAQATGLAAPTLVQRFTTRDAMLRAAISQGWQQLETETTQFESACPLNGKGALALLKALGGDLSISPMLLLTADDDPGLRAQAESWRAQVETALALRIGGGPKGREAAAALFALWQGQLLWQEASGKPVRLKDVLKRLSD
ncbi:TetR family transcriptional regulator [Gemmobacter serpentinus]|uniref:TetR family transcriptional regulator n=1 Tax=Gemmobacter serpentinus TaxID=2652247 RepID=UPI00124BD8A5|nr:TetR family transcriptional regulator [Gemmobacter serpentinus]